METGVKRNDDACEYVNIKTKVSVVWTHDENKENEFMKGVCGKDSGRERQGKTTCKMDQ